MNIKGRLFESLKISVSYYLRIKHHIFRLLSENCMINITESELSSQNNLKVSSLFNVSKKIDTLSKCII